MEPQPNHHESRKAGAIPALSRNREGPRGPSRNARNEVLASITSAVESGSRSLERGSDPGPRAAALPEESEMTTTIELDPLRLERLRLQRLRAVDAE